VCNVCNDNNNVMIMIINENINDNINNDNNNDIND